ncbi:hypothetical protein HAX54_014036 [Datura stramonium]|uniref:Uncharacterized protein n=1 Tax=Datura stramonium TaxID=4076 RepID=A0ABS8TMD3_DATST|nr:hypothetical protein [Datura stramonium]
MIWWCAEPRSRLREDEKQLFCPLFSTWAVFKCQFGKEVGEKSTGNSEYASKFEHHFPMVSYVSELGSNGEWKGCDGHRAVKICHEILANESEAMINVTLLQLSYDELPLKLKRCILCFAIYPEDYEIESSREESFCSLDENNENIATIQSRRLGVTNETLLQPLAGNSKLKALLPTKTNCIGFTGQVALAQVKSLRVLSLSNIRFEESSQFCEEDMWHWITSLKRLAYLDLRDVTNLTKLPRSIKKLWGLQLLGT